MNEKLLEQLVRKHFSIPSDVGLEPIEIKAAVNFAEAYHAEMREKLQAAVCALKKSDEAMAWELGGEPLPTLMIKARELCQKALEKIGEI